VWSTDHDIRSDSGGNPHLDPKDIGMALDLVRQERQVDPSASLSAALVGLVVLIVLAATLFLFAS